MSKKKIIPSWPQMIQFPSVPDLSSFTWYPRWIQIDAPSKYFDKHIQELSMVNG